MKIERDERSGWFRNLIGLFTRNWGLKLMALALAIIVYHSVKTEIGVRPYDHSFFTAQP